MGLVLDFGCGDTVRTFKNEYRFSIEHGAERHVWTCIGRHGALHLHISGPFDADWSGGLEVHYRVPPGYMDDCAPSSERCWLIGGPCWHDGTSLYVRETLVPLWLADRHNHALMFSILEKEYRSRLGGEA